MDLCPVKLIDDSGLAYQSLADIWKSQRQGFLRHYASQRMDGNIVQCGFELPVHVCPDTITMLSSYICLELPEVFFRTGKNVERKAHVQLWASISAKKLSTS